ncbi:hypothetical protein EDC56_0910 [Sinobacterium caligoides]|uniref:Tetratricopeptide repeat protein n=1 Tax=Sinobacterium caligoides TaxID=933926 RepID=A0A3N2DZV8_9GAMM|nr:hypothetical protein [Sinobacterium caligoides]ROS05380.1 hypothetical protein EDC56_0910 [Sinobacterium caligoides]
MMELWKSTVLEGNKAFAEGRDADAMYHYKAACQRSERLLPDWFDTEAATVAFIVSYQNLAELYFRQEKNQQGLDAYRYLAQQLKKIAAIKNINSTRQAITNCACRRVATELAYTVKKLNIESPEASALVYEMSKHNFTTVSQHNKDYLQ